MKDIYVYPDTFVLINKLNIKTSKELDEAENALVSINIANLLINPFKIKSVFDIKKVHKTISLTSAIQTTRIIKGIRSN